MPRNQGPGPAQHFPDEKKVIDALSAFVDARIAQHEATKAGNTDPAPALNVKTCGHNLIAALRAYRIGRS